MILATRKQLIFTCAKAVAKDHVKHGTLFTLLLDCSREKIEALSNTVGD